MAETNGKPAVNTNLPVRAAGGVRTLAHVLASRHKYLSDIAPSNLRPERVMKIVISAVSRTPKLMDCSIDSIFLATLQAVELGLEPGSAIGEAYLIPFKGLCQMLPGYRGLATLAYRSGFVSSLDAHEVYEGDAFRYSYGLEAELHHIPGDVCDPAKITHAYAVVRLKDGAVLFDVMNRAQIEAVRRRSRAANDGPWVTDYGEMAKKTVLKRVLKRCPASVELAKAIAADVVAEMGDRTALGEFDFAIDGEFVPMPEEEPRKTGVEAVKRMAGAEPTEQPELGGE